MKISEKRKTKKKSAFSLFNEKAKLSAPDRSRFCGSIKLKIDPLEYQRKMRNEWS